MNSDMPFEGTPNIARGLSDMLGFFEKCIGYCDKNADLEAMDMADESKDLKLQLRAWQSYLNDNSEDINESAASMSPEEMIELLTEDDEDNDDIDGETGDIHSLSDVLELIERCVECCDENIDPESADKANESRDLKMQLRAWQSYARSAEAIGELFTDDDDDEDDI